MISKNKAPKRGFVAMHMMERKLKPRGEDTRSVDIEDAYTLDFWARELDVSKAKLRAAVLAVGSAVRDVKRELKK